MRWIRAAGGVLLTLVGLLWLLQGVNVIGGSGMSGQAQYAVLGIIVALIGIWLLQGAIRDPHRSPLAEAVKR
jgi:hypothetical protein